MRELILIVTLFSSSVFANNYHLAGTNKISYEKSIELLLANINPADTVRGTVVASPSRSNPDYFYHWVRDAALVMNLIFDAALKETNQTRKQKMFSALYDYVERVKSNQKSSGFWNLGEPKYYVDGAPYTGPWGRPQHDGPGLRAITLINFANYLLDEGQSEYVLNNLYTSILPAISPIKQDLEYVARHWDKPGFDYWEEVKGLHFPTAMAHRKALILGAQLARRLGDFGAANFYEQNAKNIEGLIHQFWDSSKGYIQSTLNQTRGVWKSQLDIAVVLGVHHGGLNDGFYSVDNPLVLKTVTKIQDTFKALYEINTYSNSTIAPSIGRYPEDSYNGYRTGDIGHGWFLATFAMAEFHLRLAKSLEKNFNITDNEFYCDLIGYHIDCSNFQNQPKKYKARILNALRAKAKAYFKRSDVHAGNHGNMDEQMNRFSGYMEGAKDLTWSYASHISALLQL